jgi:hypothetical protein
VKLDGSPGCCPAQEIAPHSGLSGKRPRWHFGQVTPSSLNWSWTFSEPHFQHFGFFFSVSHLNFPAQSRQIMLDMFPLFHLEIPPYGCLRSHTKKANS